MTKYRKKPVVIEALQWTGDNEQDIHSFVEKDYFFKEFDRATNTKVLVIRTLEGDHIASVGDYIIKGVKGEFYPCKPDIFQETYEKVD